MNRLVIDHQIFPPTTPYAEKLSFSLAQVTTPLTVIAADDDFLIPQTLEQAVAFLDAHPDYSIVHGVSYSFGTDTESCYGNIINFEPYRQRSMEQDEAAERFRDHLFDYSTTYYSVHRTGQLRSSRELVREYDLHPYFAELLPSCLSVIQGKVKKIDRLYMVRQGWFFQREKERKQLLPERIDWITSPSWANQYHLVTKTLTKALLEGGVSSPADAMTLVKKATWAYLGYALSIGASSADLQRMQISRRATWKRVLMRALEKQIVPGIELYFDEMGVAARSNIHRLLTLLNLRRLFLPPRNKRLDLLDWMADPEWSCSFKVFRDGLAKTLARERRLDLSEAEERVKQVFKIYLAAWLNKFIPPSDHKFQPKTQESVSLLEMLDSSHPYADDFFAVYELVTEGKPLFTERIHKGLV